METLKQVLGEINGVIWGYLLVYFLLGVGVYFTVRSRFIQFRLFGHPE